MRHLAGVVACAVGGFIAMLCLVAPNPSPAAGNVVLFKPGAGWDMMLHSAPAAAIAGVLTTAIVTVLPRREVSGAAWAGVGLLILAIVGAVPSTDVGATYATTVAAGIAVGGFCILITESIGRTQRRLAASLLAGATTGLLCQDPLRAWRRASPIGSRVYADYLPRGASTTSASDLVMIGCASVALVAVTCLAFVAVKQRAGAALRPEHPPGSGRGVVVGSGITLVAAFVYFAVRQHSSAVLSEIGLRSWWFIAMIVVLAMIGAITVRGRSGLTWMGTAAVVVAAATTGVSGGNLLVVTIGGIISAVGAVIALRWPLPTVGFGALAVAVLLQLATGDGGELWAASASIFVMPLASAFTLVSLWTTAASSGLDASVVAPALGSIGALGVMAGATVDVDFGWTSYTPLAGAGFLDLGSSNDAVIAAAAASLAVCTAFSVVIARRPTPGSVGDHAEGE